MKDASEKNQGVVVVTGAARGLGRQIAHQVAEDGMAVAVIDLDIRSYRHFASEAGQMEAESTDAELRDRGVVSEGFEVDLTDRDAVIDVFDTIEGTLGPIVGLVCNAGGGSGGVHDNKAGNLDLDTLQTMLERNLFTTVNCCVAAARPMRARGAGSIAVMSSVNGLDPMPDGAYAHYGVAKAASLMYARYLARDLGPSGIRVNTIAPGTVPTGRLKDVWAKVGNSDMGASLALRRLPEPREIADIAAFLMSDRSSYMTGQTLTVDGGRTAHPCVSG